MAGLNDARSMFTDAQYTGAPSAAMFTDRVRPVLQSDAERETELARMQALSYGDVGGGFASGLRGSLGSAKAYIASGLDAMGANDMARGTYASAAEDMQMANNVAPEIGRLEQVHGLADAGRWALGKMGGGASAIPLAMAGGAAGRAMLGTNAGAMLGSAASFQPVMAGASVQALNGNPNTADMSAGEKFGHATALGSAQAALLGYAPGMMINKSAATAMGRGANNGVLRDTLESSGAMGVASTGSGLMGQYAMQGVDPTKEIHMGEALEEGLGATVGMLPIAGAHSMINNAGDVGATVGKFASDVGQKMGGKAVDKGMDAYNATKEALAPLGGVFAEEGSKIVGNAKMLKEFKDDIGAQQALADSMGKSVGEIGGATAATIEFQADALLTKVLEKATTGMNKLTEMMGGKALPEDTVKSLRSTPEQLGAKTMAEIQSVEAAQVAKAAEYAAPLAASGIFAESHPELHAFVKEMTTKPELMNDHANRVKIADAFTTYKEARANAAMKAALEGEEAPNNQQRTEHYEAVDNALQELTGITNDKYVKDLVTSKGMNGAASVLFKIKRDLSARVEYANNPDALNDAMAQLNRRLQGVFVKEHTPEGLVKEHKVSAALRDVANDAMGDSNKANELHKFLEMYVNAVRAKGNNLDLKTIYGMAKETLEKTYELGEAAGDVLVRATNAAANVVTSKDAAFGNIIKSGMSGERQTSGSQHSRMTSDADVRSDAQKLMSFMPPSSLRLLGEMPAAAREAWLRNTHLALTKYAIDFTSLGNKQAEMESAISSMFKNPKALLQYALENAQKRFDENAGRSTVNNGASKAEPELFDANNLEYNQVVAERDNAGTYGSDLAAFYKEREESNSGVQGSIETPVSRDIKHFASDGENGWAPLNNYPSAKFDAHGGEANKMLAEINASHAAGEGSRASLIDPVAHAEYMAEKLNMNVETVLEKQKSAYLESVVKRRAEIEARIQELGTSPGKPMARTSESERATLQKELGSIVNFILPRAETTNGRGFFETKTSHDKDMMKSLRYIRVEPGTGTMLPVTMKSVEGKHASTARKPSDGAIHLLHKDGTLHKADVPSMVHDMMRMHDSAQDTSGMTRLERVQRAFSDVISSLLEEGKLDKNDPFAATENAYPMEYPALKGKAENLTHLAKENFPSDLVIFRDGKNEITIGDLLPPNPKNAVLSAEARRAVAPGNKLKSAVELAKAMAAATGIHELGADHSRSLVGALIERGLEQLRKAGIEITPEAMARHGEEVLWKYGKDGEHELTVGQVLEAIKERRDAASKLRGEYRAAKAAGDKQTMNRIESSGKEMEVNLSFDTAGDRAQAARERLDAAIKNEALAVENSRTVIDAKNRKAPGAEKSDGDMEANHLMRVRDGDRINPAMEAAHERVNNARTAAYKKDALVKEAAESAMRALEWRDKMHEVSEPKDSGVTDLHDIVTEGIGRHGEIQNESSELQGGKETVFDRSQALRGDGRKLNANDAMIESHVRAGESEAPTDRASVTRGKEEAQLRAGERAAKRRDSAAGMRDDGSPAAPWSENTIATKRYSVEDMLREAVSEAATRIDPSQPHESVRVALNNQPNVAHATGGKPAAGRPAASLDARSNLAPVRAVGVAAPAEPAKLPTLSLSKKDAATAGELKLPDMTDMARPQKLAEVAKFVKVATKEQIEAALAATKDNLVGNALKTALGQPTKAAELTPKERAAAAVAEYNAQENTPFNNETPGSERTDTDAGRAAVAERASTVYGDSVDHVFKHLGIKSGTISEANGKNIIEIAQSAHDPVGVYNHEGWHVLEKIMGAHKNGEKMLAAVYRAMSTPAVRNFLESHFASEADVLKQLEGSMQERAAYMFQLWSGASKEQRAQLPLGNESKTIFGKLWDGVKAMLGFVSDKERTQKMFEYLDSGKFKNEIKNPEAWARDIGETRTEKFAEKVKDAAKPIVEIANIIFTDTHTRVRDMKNEHYTAAIDLLMGKSENGGYGYMHRVNSETNKYMNKAQDAVRGHSAEEQNAALAILRDGTSEGASSRAIELSQKMGDVLNLINADRTAAGLTNSRANLVKSSLDVDMIENNRAEWARDLREHGGWGERSATYIHDMTDKIVNAGRHEGKEELFPDTPAGRAKLAKWQSKTLMQVVNAHSVANAKQIGMARIDKEAEAHGYKSVAELVTKGDIGATESQRRVMADAVKAAHGDLGSHMSPSVRKVISAIIVGENIMSLPFAVLTQLMDPFTLAIRKNSMNTLVEDFGRGITDVFTKGWANDPVATDKWERLSQHIGTTVQAQLVNSIGDVYTGVKMSTTMRKINNAFFKANLMSAFDRAMHVAATKNGVEFITQHAKSSDAISTRFLKELGLTKEDVVMKDGELDMSSPKLVDAVRQFVRESVVHPDAATNPLWMNDPHFALISHMKRFTFAFSKLILGRLEHEYGHGNYAALLPVLPLVGFAMLDGMLKGLITSDVKGTGGSASFGLMEGIQKAGLAGKSEFVTDLLLPQNGRSGIASTLGPFASDVNNWTQHAPKAGG